MAIATSSVAVAASMFYAQTTERPRHGEIPAASPTAQPSAPATTPSTASPAAAELVAASAPLSANNFQFALPQGIAPENGLQIHTILVARAIAVMFPEIQTIGGYPTGHETYYAMAS